MHTNVLPDGAGRGRDIHSVGRWRETKGAYRTLIYIYTSGGGGGGANTKSLKKVSAAVLFRPPPIKKKSFSKIDNFAYDHI